MSFWSNICNAADNVKYVWNDGIDSFNNGNWTAGVYRTVVMAPLAAGGNIITLGGVNALGNVICDANESGASDEHTNALDGIGDAICHYVEWEGKNEAESYLMQDDLSTGVYNEYKWNDDENCFVIDRDKDGNLKSYKAVTDEEKAEFKNLANRMGGVDVGFAALEVAGACGAGKALKTVWKPVVKNASKTVAKTTAKTVAKTTVKATAKKGAKEVAEELVENSVEKSAKKGAKEVAEELVENSVEKSAKKGVKEIAEEMVENSSEKSAKKGVKEIAEEMVENSSEKSAKISLKSGINGVTDFTDRVKKSGKIVGFTAVGETLSKRFGNGKTVADIEMHGVTYALADATKDTASLVVDVTEDVTGGALATGGNVVDKWLAKHPVLGKFVNTCKSAYYASTKSFTNNKVGALAVATIAKPVDKIKSFIGSSTETYRGMNINEMANQFKAESIKDNKKWSDHYVERVKELDAELGIDSSTRTLVSSKEVVANNSELGLT